MTKAEVIACITKKTGKEKEPTLAVVGQFFEVVTSCLANGENVVIKGFGTFLVKKRNETTGRNLHTNTAMIVPAHFIPMFRPGEDFKNAVKGANVKKQSPVAKRSKAIVIP